MWAGLYGGRVDGGGWVKISFLSRFRIVDPVTKMTLKCIRYEFLRLLRQLHASPVHFHIDVMMMVDSWPPILYLFAKKRVKFKFTPEP